MSQDYEQNEGYKALQAFQISAPDRPKWPTMIQKSEQAKTRKRALDEYEERQLAKQLEEDFA